MQEIADCGLELEQKEKPTLRPAQGRLSRKGREKWGTPAGEWRRAVDGVESAERKESYQWAVFGRCAVQSEDQPCLTCLHKNCQLTLSAMALIENCRPKVNESKG